MHGHTDIKCVHSLALNWKQKVGIVLNVLHNYRGKYVDCWFSASSIFFFSPLIRISCEILA
jgi:hypothetical protein